MAINLSEPMGIILLMGAPLIKGNRNKKKQIKNLNTCSEDQMILSFTPKGGDIVDFD